MVFFIRDKARHTGSFFTGFLLLSSVLLIAGCANNKNNNPITKHKQATALSPTEVAHVEALAKSKSQTTIDLVEISPQGEISTRQVPTHTAVAVSQSLKTQGITTALDLAVQTESVDGETSLVADESLLFSAKEIFGLNEWALSNPESDGRHVTIAVVDDGVALDRPGLITTSTGRPKISRSINMGTLWHMPLRETLPEGCTIPAAESKERSAQWTFAESTGLTAEVLTDEGSVAFDVTECGINRELAARPTSCPRWQGLWLNDRPAGTPKPTSVAARLLRGVPHRIAIDVDGNGVIEPSELLLPLSEDEQASGPRTYRFSDGRSLAFDLVQGDRFPKIESSMDMPLLPCLNGAKQPELVLTMAVPESSNDFGSHGEGVASVAAGYRIGGRPFDGMAPGAQLVNVSFADEYSGRSYNISTIAKALRAGGLSADIVNLSYSLYFNSPAAQVSMARVLERALGDTKALYFFSAGNNGPGRGSMNRGLIYPSLALVVGAYLDPGASQTVFGSSVPWGGVVGYSSRGPGPDGNSGPMVISPLAGMVASTADAGFRSFSGTSSATPALAGFTARLISHIRAMTHEDRFDRQALKAAILQSAEALPDVAYVDQGYGVPKLSKAWDIYQRTATAPAVKPPEAPLALAVAKQSPSLIVNGGRNHFGLVRRGIYVRGSLDRKDFYTFQITPSENLPSATFVESLRLHTDAPWISLPSAVLMSSGGVQFEVALNWNAIEAMAASELTTHIDIRNADTGERRAVIPVTIIAPVTNQADRGQTSFNLSAAGLKRLFVNKPLWATHLAVKVQASNPEQALCSQIKFYNPSGVRVGGASTFGSNAEQTDRTFEAASPGIYEITIEGRSNHTACPRQQTITVQYQWFGIDVVAESVQRRPGSDGSWVSVQVFTNGPAAQGSVRFGEPKVVTHIELLPTVGRLWTNRQPINLGQYTDFQLALDSRATRQMALGYSYTMFDGRIFSSNATRWPLGFGLPTNGAATRYIYVNRTGVDVSEYVESRIVVNTFDYGVDDSGVFAGSLPLRILTSPPSAIAQLFRESRATGITLRQGQPTSVLVPGLGFESMGEISGRLVAQCYFKPQAFSEELPCGEVDLY